MSQSATPITDAVRSSGQVVAMAHWLPWRAENEIVYAEVDIERPWNDVHVGEMATAELAAEAVASHNAALAQAERLRPR